jgi:DNA polymerase III delta subunit
MPNAYFLFGNDEFAITRKLKEFEADFTDPTSADMNTARLEARSMSEDDLNNAVNAMPFLAKRRWCCCKPLPNITIHLSQKFLLPRKRQRRRAW